jgi:hypothetical protein
MQLTREVIQSEQLIQNALPASVARSFPSLPSLSFSMHKQEIFIRGVFRWKMQLTREVMQSEQLILNTLPASVARFSFPSLPSLSFSIHKQEMFIQGVFRWKTQLTRGDPIRAAHTKHPPSPSLPYPLSFSMHKQEIFIRGVFRWKMQLTREVIQSEQLIRNTLPASVALRLQRGDFPVCDEFKDCTVAVVDISFGKETGNENTIVALSDIFCVSTVFFQPIFQSRWR